MKSKNQLRRERKKTARAAPDKSSDQDEVPVVSSDPPAGPGNKQGTTETTKSNAPKSSATVLARKYEWMSPADPLFGMYQQVSARFKRSRESDDDGENPERTSEEHMQEVEPSEPSRKQLRKSTKPSLVELKKESKHPELVEWYDADAPYPHLLVQLKSIPHVVQVPRNWRSRSEIPQFGPKPKYEPPSNIAETDIANARKGARLDIDYEKMHASFFSPESEQALPHLLPYGNVVDLRLRRNFKPSTSRSSTSLPSRPTQVSMRLREALGIGDKDELPWSTAVRRMGLAPGYAGRSEAKYERWGLYSG